MRELRTNVRSEPASTSDVDFKAEYAGIFRDWISSWKEVAVPGNLTGDLLAGLTVAAVALPLNLALAVASGLPPGAGLLAGAIGGGVAALFGGARFQVTGPAAALNVMVFLLVAEFGVVGAAAAAVMVGVISIILGLLLAGKVAKFVPEAVLAGFTSGVGLKLLDQQIPELLGFDYKVSQLAAMMHRPTWLHEVSWLAVVCGLFVAVLILSTRRWKRLPGALIGVSIVTALSVYLDWDIERVGEIPSVFPTPSFPMLADAQWLPLMLKAVPLGLLAAVESLLSAQILDKMSGTKKPHNPNLELFGQGVANIASGLVGGMPVTGVVVRSSVNLQGGGRTRLSSLVHAAILLFSVLYLSDQLARIPLAGLAGLLCVIGVRLIEVGEFFHLLKSHKIAAVAFAVTMAGTVTGHLVEGLAGGMIIYAIDWLVTRKSREQEETKTELRAQGVRAVVGQIKGSESRRPAHYAPAESSGQWLTNVRARAQAAATAFVHPHASVIGHVVLGDNVHVAADSSIRADEGTPFFIGSNSNVQDGVVMHALKDKHVKVGGENWAIYVGKNVSMAHHALVHGPCYIGDNSFVGFKAIVHDAVVGSHCFIGIGAIVVGVEIPDGRYVPHGMLVDSADKVDALPRVTDEHLHFNEDVVEVNKGLAAAYREVGTGSRAVAHPSLGRLPDTVAALIRSVSVTETSRERF